MSNVNQGKINAEFDLHFGAQSQKAFHLQVKLSLPSKGIIALFGHSGSGKTTLLRCMAGLQTSPNGHMAVNAQIWQDGTCQLATHQRNLAYVFQDQGLLNHLTVKANIDYALKRAKHPARNLQPEIIELMALQSLLNHYPAQLSGGEKQRVAIARSLLVQPQLILMDEPLASLDQRHKQEILPYLETLKHKTQVPIIYVSHDINEVARLADYVVVLEHGKVILQGETNRILPQISQISSLSEEASVVLTTEVIARDQQWHLIQVKLSQSQQHSLWLRDNGETIGQTVRLRLMAKDISITLEHHADSSIVNRLAATIKAIHSDPDPAMALIELQLAKCCVFARITQRSVSHLKLDIGMQVWAQIKSVAIVS